jgi:hypothetical protein
MAEESRLGREVIQTGWVLKQIIEAGVRVFFYLEDRERTLANAMDKVMLSLANFASEMEREKAKQRTYDAMRRGAEHGYAAAGKTYGYDNLAVTSLGPDGRPRRDHVVQQINPAEAAVVRRIFALAAEGHGLVRIAKTLIADGVPPPRADGHTGWAPTGIREMLRRETYIGRVVWGKTGWVDRGGRKSRSGGPRPSGSGATPRSCASSSRPSGRRCRPGTRRSTPRTCAIGAGGCTAAPRGRGRAPTCCPASRSARGAGAAWSPTSKRASAHDTRTMYHRTRGVAACGNALIIPMAAADQLVLDALARDVLQPTYVRRFLGDAMAAAQATLAPVAERRRALEDEHRRGSSRRSPSSSTTSPPAPPGP